LEEEGVDWRIILKCIFETWNGAKERGRWWALVSAVIKLRIP
jgi:hypothetical protein